MTKLILAFLASLLTACGAAGPGELADDVSDVLVTAAAPAPEVDTFAPAPAACGELGQACCAGGGQACNGGAHADIYCSTGGVCRAPVADCGGEGQACCNPLCDTSGACWTAACENGAACGAGSLCEAVKLPDDCGLVGQACCYQEGISYCGVGADCDGVDEAGNRTCI